MRTPLFTIVIGLNDKNKHLLPFTLDGIASQTFNEYELIIADGCLGTADIYTNGKHLRCENENLFALFNAGAQISTGTYLNFLSPGEYYFSRNVLAILSSAINENGNPGVLYSGSILRQSYAKPEINLKEINGEELRGGKIPSTLHPFWFSRLDFLNTGGFNEHFKVQGGADLICRFFTRPLRKIFLKRILTDYEYRRPIPKVIIQQNVEMLKIVYHYFGWSKALLWWIAQNHIRFFRWWLKSLKNAFSTTHK